MRKRKKRNTQKVRLQKSRPGVRLSWRTFQLIKNVIPHNQLFWSKSKSYADLEVSHLMVTTSQRYPFEN